MVGSDHRIFGHRGMGYGLGKVVESLVFPEQGGVFLSLDFLRVKI